MFALHSVLHGCAVQDIEPATQATGECINGNPSVSFFLSPGQEPSGDMSWQAHVSGFTEFDFEDIAPGASIDSLSAGPTNIDLSLEGINGTAPRVGTFRSSEFSVPGVFFGNALLNEWYQAHSRISFTFSEPVEGIGMWIFDDTVATRQSFRLIVTDASGTISASPVLESGNGYAHAIEGFMGATSTVGITKVSIENLEEQCRTPSMSYFEIDHVQIGNRHTYTNTNSNGICNPSDNSLAVPNPGQRDWGGDDLGNSCDTCPASVDLIASEVTSSCGSATEGLTLSARVTNQGTVAVSAGLKVAFYQGDPASGGTLLGVATLPGTLAASASAMASIVLTPAPGGTATIFAVADDDGTGHGRELECQEDNNVASASVSLACAADCLEVRLSEYNLFLLEDYKLGTDVEGKVAAGGNITLNHFSAGHGLPDNNLSYSLVAGGDLSLSNGGVWGDAWYRGGYSTDTTVIYPRGVVAQGTPIDFAARGVALRTLSSRLAGLTVNGTTTIESWGGIMLRGTDPEVNVFQVPANAFSGAVLLSIDAPADSMAVVNISGATITLKGGHSFSGGIDQHGVLFNLVDATAINAQGYGLWGTVLAPYAHVTFNEGSFDGGIYARSLTGNAEGHINALHDRDICQCTNMFFADEDGDGHGDPANAVEACVPPLGFVADGDDCDDSDASAYPGAEEICDGRDNDCDGSVDPEGVCFDCPVLGEWRFDTDTGAIAYDTSGSGHHGSVVGATWTSSGYRGGALDFDGVNDFVVANWPGFAAPAAVSMSAWVQPDQIAATEWDSVVGVGSASNTLNPYWLGYYQRRATLHTSNGMSDYRLSDDGNYSGHVGEWHYLAAVWDGATRRRSVYVDGVLTAEDFAGPSAVPDMGAPLRIGADTNYGAPALHFDGRIDEVKVFACALRYEDIQRDFLTGHPLQ